MKKVKLLFMMLLTMSLAFGQTTTTTKIVNYKIPSTKDSTVVTITITNTINDTVFVQSPCDTTKPPTQSPVVIMLYVGSDFTTIVKDPAKSLALKKYCKDYGYNGVSYYGLSSISEANWSYLRSFNEDIRTNYGVIQVEATASNNAGFTQRLKFNSTCTNAKQKFDFFNKESEYWNADDNGDGVHSDAEVLAAWKKDSVDAFNIAAAADVTGVNFTWYHGWDLKTQLPLHLVKIQDQLLYHVYRKTPETAYLMDRLTRANEAQKMIDPTKKKDTGILISAELDFMQVYLKTHTLKEVADFYKAFVNGFSNLNFTKLQVFMYSEILKSQPAKSAMMTRSIATPETEINTTTDSHKETAKER